MQTEHLCHKLSHNTLPYIIAVFCFQIRLFSWSIAQYIYSVFSIFALDTAECAPSSFGMNQRRRPLYSEQSDHANTLYERHTWEDACKPPQADAVVPEAYAAHLFHRDVIYFAHRIFCCFVRVAVQKLVVLCLTVCIFCRRLTSAASPCSLHFLTFAFFYLSGEAVV